MKHNILSTLILTGAITACGRGVSFDHGTSATTCYGVTNGLDLIVNTNPYSLHFEEGGGLALETTIISVEVDRARGVAQITRSYRSDHTASVPQGCSKRISEPALSYIESLLVLSSFVRQNQPVPLDAGYASLTLSNGSESRTIQLTSSQNDAMILDRGDELARRLLVASACPTSQINTLRRQ